MTPPTTLVDSISVRVPKVRVASPSIRPFWGAPKGEGSPDRVEAMDAEDPVWVSWGIDKTGPRANRGGKCIAEPG